MKEIPGKNRVIIENVAPQIEEGKFPAKRAISEPFTVSANIFADGHDLLDAAVLYRKKGKKSWEKVFMQESWNDQWTASFIPEELGFYEYTVVAWIDHFRTWQQGLKKKYEANQQIDVELAIGAELLKNAASNSPKALAEKLKKWAGELESVENPHQVINLALSNDVAQVVKMSEAQNVTQHHRVLDLEVERTRALFSSWYEFFPRSASSKHGQHGTFRDCETVLPEVAKMGFDVVYFPPIHPIGKLKRKGKNNSLQAGANDPGSPWAVGSDEGGHKAIHPELGTLSDFKRLIKKADELDIEIALDIAFQCAPDHPWVKEHPEWFKWRPDGTVQYAENPPKRYEDILPLNFETNDWENLWKELKSVFDYWIEQGIKIFRVDNPHTKSFRFWEWAIGEIRSKNPEVIFLAEAFTKPNTMQRLAKAGFNQSYTYFTWRNTSYELAEYMRELTETPMRDYYRPNFWPNTPDILPPQLTYGGEPAHILRVLLAGTLSSNYGLYGPVYEYMVNQTNPDKEEYWDSEKYEIKSWDWKKHTRTKDVIIRLNQIRKANAALQQTANIRILNSSNPEIFAFAKMDQTRNNIIIVAANMNFYENQGSMIQLPLYDFGIDQQAPFTVRDLISGSKYNWQGDWNYVELNPNSMPAHIFVLEKA